MATYIKSINDLSKILEPRIKKALEMTQDEIWEIIQSHIDEYYKEYTPKKYIRSFKFQTESLIKTKIHNDRNKLYCTVEIDPDYLDYSYPGNRVTGADVVMMAANKSHGGVYDDDFSRFWDDAMAEIGLAPGILYIMKKNLKECGVPVR